MNMTKVEHPKEYIPVVGDRAAALSTLQFRANKRLDAYINSVFGAALVLAGVVGIPTSYDSWWTIWVALLSVGFGIGALVSAAYIFRGRLIIACNDEGWFTVTRVLWRMKRCTRFPAYTVRGVEEVSSGPTEWMIRVELAWPSKFIGLGGGFHLAESERETIKQMLWRAKDLYQ